jgi:N-acetylmuramoyl-L-alanine amidase
MRQLDTIILHCSATPPDWMAGRGVEAKRDEIDRWHKARGWRGIGYHFLVDRDGKIAKGRPVSEVGAHVSGHNIGSIGICLVGGKWPQGAWGVKTDDFFDHFTPAQDVAVRDLVDSLSDLYGIEHIKGHNDFTDTKGCPSFTVSEWLKDIPAQAPPSVNSPPRERGGFFAVLMAALASLFTRKPAKPQKLGPQGFVPVPHQGRTIWVMPDFYKRDGIRMPVTGVDALRIAQEKSRALGLPLTLPTKEMVDSIHKAATKLVMPTRGEPRQSIETYRSVDAEIERALAGRAGLVSGHKKEILRPARAGRVTIYGGMKSDGTFWQPVSSVHGETYTDYSHGLRLVYDPEE